MPALYPPKIAPAEAFHFLDEFFDPAGAVAQKSGSTGAAVCEPGGRWASITVDPGAPDALWAATRPLLTLTLAELLKRQGLYFLHAAGVTRAGGAVLLPGTSGSGKSTLAVALARYRRVLLRERLRDELLPF